MNKLVEALERVANEPFRYRWEGSPKQTPKQIAQQALSEHVAEEVTRVNPYKDLKCKYVYDYCNPETCTCSKSWKWEVENNSSEHAVNKARELKSRMRVDGSFKRMQPVLNKESGMLSISQEELIKELEDKRLCKFSNLDETMYSLSLKHTAEHLLDKFLITPLSTSPK